MGNSTIVPLPPQHMHPIHRTALAGVLLLPWTHPAEAGSAITNVPSPVDRRGQTEVERLVEE